MVAHSLSWDQWLVFERVALALGSALKAARGEQSGAGRDDEDDDAFGEVAASVSSWRLSDSGIFTSCRECVQADTGDREEAGSIGEESERRVG